MCIHWCCKHCSTELYHRWAYERCNEYFVARSQDENLVACPNGPWLLRRAYHRHPFRGPQRCDPCKKACRKDKKVEQLARQKANMALGHRHDYNGARFLGELEIRDTTHARSQLPLEPRILDAMKAKWESFNATHGHLPSHELEREWTKTFTASTNVDLKAGVSPSMTKHASTTGQRISPVYRQISSSICEANRSLRQAAPALIHCNHNSIIKRVNNTLEALSIAKQLTPYKQNNDPTPFTVDRLFSPIEGASSRSPGDQQLLHHNNLSKRTCESNFSTVVQNEPFRESGHSEVSSSSTSATISSSSQPTRTRPWDL